MKQVRRLIVISRTLLIQRKIRARRKGLAEGIEIGKKEGRIEGKIEANTETAQRLLAMGLSAEQVAKATQLPLDIIENLRNS